jgi:hypothetical protein
MPRRKKKAAELPDAELFHKVFPKKVREEATRTALDSRKKTTKKQSK